MAPLEGDRAGHAADHRLVAILDIRIVENALAREVLAAERRSDDLEESFAKRTRKLELDPSLQKFNYASRGTDLDLTCRELGVGRDDDSGLLAKFKHNVGLDGTICGHANCGAKRIGTPLDGVNPFGRARFQHHHLTLCALAAHQREENLPSLRRGGFSGLLGRGGLLLGGALLLRKGRSKGGKNGDGRQRERCLE